MFHGSGLLKLPGASQIIASGNSVKQLIQNLGNFLTALNP